MVMAESPSTDATSRRCARYEASSIDRSSWNGSRTAGMTPAGNDTSRYLNGDERSAGGAPRDPGAAAYRAYRRAGAGATCRATSASCRASTPTSSGPSASATPSPARCSPCREPGDPRLPELGEDLDIRTDVPRYRVFIDGELAERGRGPAAPLARRPGDLRPRLLVLVRGSADRRRAAAALRRAGPQRADVPHQRGHGAGGPLPRQAGGLDAPVQAGRRDPRHRDHLALSARARLAGAPRPPRPDRHRRPVAAVGRRSDRGARRRAAAVLGLRRHAAVGGARCASRRSASRTRPATCWSPTWRTRASPNADSKLSVDHRGSPGCSRSRWRRASAASPSRRSCR